MILRTIFLTLGVLVLTGACICGMAHVASAGALDGDTVQISKAKRGAYVGFTVKWGGTQPPQKYLVVKSFLPTPGFSPVTAMTGTVIPLNAVSDFNPLGWSRRTQVIAAAGVITSIFIISNNTFRHNRHHNSGPAFSEEEPDEGSDGDDDGDSDSDEDSDSFPEHCDDGYGEDYEQNKHCF